jgi:hypothetical protein
MVDGAGLGIWDIAPSQSTRCCALTPRTHFKRRLLVMVRAEAAVVPGGRLALLVGCGMPLAVRIALFGA